MLLEIVVLLQVGAAIGVGWTVALLITTSVLGTWLLRIGGRRAWSTFRAALSQGRWPGDGVADGAFIMAGGMLLVTPGFVTDAVGLLTLLAPLRRRVTRWIHARSVGPDGRGRRRPSRGGDAPQLAVEVLEIERETGPSRPPRPSTPEHDGRTP